MTIGEMKTNDAIQRMATSIRHIEEMLADGSKMVVVHLKDVGKTAIRRDNIVGVCNSGDCEWKIVLAGDMAVYAYSRAETLEEFLKEIGLD